MRTLFIKKYKQFSENDSHYYICFGYILWDSEHNAPDQEGDETK